MIYLVLQVCMGTAFQQVLRLGQLRREHVLCACAVNYCVASLFAVGRLVTSASPVGDAWPIAAALGAVNGVLFAVHLLVLLASYRRAGVGIAVAVASSGAILPVLTAWALWHGPMTNARWLAVALLPPAMLLLRPRAAETTHLDLRADLTLAGNFVIGGLILTLHKAQHVYAGPDTLMVYHLSLFCVAMLTTWAYVLARRLPVTRHDVAIGVPLGLVNSLNLLFLLLALAQLPATVFFPTSGVAVIVLNVVMSRLLWKERITRLQAVGLLAALVIVALVNIER